MKKYCLGIVALIITILFLLQPVVAGQGTVKIADQVFSVDIVRTPEARTRGLSGRKMLNPNTGMLFIFDYPSLYSIWMKAMRFPIDILWIDQFASLVHIERRVSPASYPKTFQSTKSALYVLEIPAGASQSFRVDMPVYFSKEVINAEKEK